MNVNHVAFAVSTSSAAGAIVSAVAAGTTAKTVAVVAYAILSVGCAAISTAAIAAWIITSNLEKSEQTVQNYFSRMGEKAGAIFAGFLTVAGDVLTHSVFRGLGQRIERAIAGPVVVEHRLGIAS